MHRSANFCLFDSGMWKRKLEAVKYLWKRKQFEERSWKRKQTRKHLTFWGAEAFFIKHEAEVWKRKLEVVKFLWKRKHFEERSWKRKQTREQLTLYGTGSGSKKYPTAGTSLVWLQCESPMMCEQLHTANGVAGSVHCHCSVARSL